MAHTTQQAESEENSSFPVDGHQTILNKAKKKTVKQKVDEQWQLE